MKGFLLTRLPDAMLVDITPAVPPQEIESARLTLARVWRRFPAGTVHLVVVDPGVGTERAALAVSSDERFLVGPDNGVLSPLCSSPERAPSRSMCRPRRHRAFPDATSSRPPRRRSR